MEALINEKEQKMKFTRNKFAQKLIIVLVVLLVFNVTIPKEINAWDLGGILLKPFVSVILTTVITVDTTIGLILNGASIRS